MAYPDGQVKGEQLVNRHTPDVRYSEIQQQNEMLEKSLEGLRMIFVDLQDRVDFAMRPATPQATSSADGQKQPESPQMSPIAYSLRRYRHAVDDMIERGQEILARLDS